MSPKEALPVVEKKGLLPDVDPRTPPPAVMEGSEEYRMDKGIGVGQAGASGGSAARLRNLVAQSRDAEGSVQAGGRKGTDQAGNGTVGDHPLQALQESDSGHRAGDSRRQP